MRFMIVAGLAALAACTPAGQRTNEAPAAVAPAEVTLAGEYMFGGANLTAEVCDMTLQSNTVEGAPAFHNVDLAPECTEHYPFLIALSGWEELDGGGIRLVGAEGSTLGDFRLRDRVFEGVVENDGQNYLLTPASVWANPQ